MALTITEKEHWKTRIARKISQAIEELLAKSNPDYLKEVAAAARIEAIHALGIAELLSEEKQLKEEVKKLDKKQQDVTRRLLAAARGVDVSEVYGFYGWTEEVERAIKQRQQSLEKKLLATDELGRQVLKLRGEEEELLDTVWLATSSQQIRVLWQSVSELLAGELTQLQQQALRNPPMEDSAA